MYPHLDTHGQPISNLGPPLSQTGSIFTYNTPTTDHQETYSSQPGGPPALTGIPPRAPGALPPEYVARISPHLSKNLYGARFGAQFGGFGVSLPTQYGAKNSVFSPTHRAVVSSSLLESETIGERFHQDETTIYNSEQMNLSRGFNTMPTAYSISHVATEEGRKNRKLVMLIVCCITFFIVIISIYFGIFIS